MSKKKLEINIDGDESAAEATKAGDCPPSASMAGSILEDPDANALLKALQGDPTLLTPRLSIYVSYPKAEALLRGNGEKVTELIAGLWSEGFLMRNLQTVVYKCPNDGTISLRPRRLCPKCKSEDLERVAMIEHLGASHVDTEQRFLRNGQYVCPICGKSLKLIGVDYRKAGNAYHCLSCGALSPEAIKLWACNQSQHSFTEDEAVVEKVYSYTLNPEKEVPDTQPVKPSESANDGDVFTRIEGFISGGSGGYSLTGPVAEVYKKHGYTVQMLHSVRGRSGALHMVDLYASRPPVSVMMWAFDGGDIDTDEFSKLASVQGDVNPTRAIVIAVPPLPHRIEGMIKKEGLTVVEGKDAEEVVEKIELFIEIDELGQRADK